jgi:beta-glucosidase
LPCRRDTGACLDKAGIGKTLGLIHVEIDTLVRTRKRSYNWYADLIRTHHGATA